MKVGLFMWDIYCRLHSVISRHESTREGIRACEASRHVSIYQFMCPARSTHIFLMTLVSKEIRREDSLHLVPRYRPLVERFQYIKINEPNASVRPTSGIVAI